jgi:hypothetical protein
MSPGTIERTVKVSAGTELVHVGGTIPGYRYAVRFVAGLAGDDKILAHDLAHRYLWVPDDAVEP